MIKLYDDEIAFDRLPDNCKLSSVSSGIATEAAIADELSEAKCRSAAVIVIISAFFDPFCRSSIKKIFFFLLFFEITENPGMRLSFSVNILY